MKLVRVIFKDHTHSPAEGLGLMDCVVYGWLFREDDQALYVASWHALGLEPDHNSECFTILKHPGLVVETLGVASRRTLKGNQRSSLPNAQQKRQRKT